MPLALSTPQAMPTINIQSAGGGGRSANGVDAFAGGLMDGASTGADIMTKFKGMELAKQAQDLQERKFGLEQQSAQRAQDLHPAAMEAANLGNEATRMQIQTAAKNLSMADLKTNMAFAEAATHITEFPPEQQEDAKKLFIRQGVSAGIITPEKAKEYEAMTPAQAAQEGHNAMIFSQGALAVKKQQEKANPAAGSTSLRLPDGTVYESTTAAPGVEKGLVKNDVATLKTLGEQATSAQQELPNYATYRNALRNSSNDIKGAVKLIIAPYARVAGIDVNTASEEQIKSLSGQFWLARANSIKGALSDKEGARLDAMIPQLLTSKEGTLKLLDIDEAGKQRVIQEEQFKRAWLKKNGSLDGANATWARFQEENSLISDDNTLHDRSHITNWSDYIKNPNYTRATEIYKNDAGKEYSGLVISQAAARSGKSEADIMKQLNLKRAQ